MSFFYFTRVRAGQKTASAFGALLTAGLVPLPAELSGSPKVNISRLGGMTALTSLQL